MRSGVESYHDHVASSRVVERNLLAASKDVERTSFVDLVDKVLFSYNLKKTS
jgi:hypothetical protein